ncbi:putative sister chromatid cohesion protein Pds5 [Helianthus anomalus]
MNWDFHIDSVFTSMENIMVLDESEEISIEMLKPLLACVKKNREVQRLQNLNIVYMKISYRLFTFTKGILPVAHKLGK